MGLFREELQASLKGHRVEYVPRNSWVYAASDLMR
jgi:hypothetical protein